MNFEEFKQELLKDPKFRKVYEDKTDKRFKVSEDIHELRVRAGLTQEQLAKKIGTKQSSIARAESGVAPHSLNFLEKIAKALDTSLLEPKFASLEKHKTETQTFEEPLILSTSDWKINTKTISQNSGQKSIKQLINQ